MKKQKQSFHVDDVLIEEQFIELPEEVDTTYVGPEKNSAPISRSHRNSDNINTLNSMKEALRLRIVNEKGKPLANTGIQVQRHSARWSLTTDGDGRASSEPVDPGVYEITVQGAKRFIPTVPRRGKEYILIELRSIWPEESQGEEPFDSFEHRYEDIELETDKEAYDDEMVDPSEREEKSI